MDIVSEILMDVRVDASLLETPLLSEGAAELGSSDWETLPETSLLERVPLSEGAGMLLH
jgi:hypothetical protein